MCRRIWLCHRRIGVLVAAALEGGDYEQRTVIALSLRTVVWTALAAIGWRLIGTAKSAQP